MQLNTITLSIAAFNLKLQSEAGIKISLEEGYQHFISTDDQAKTDILIRAREKKDLPADYLNEMDLIFEAKDPQLKYFSIYQEKQGYKFFIFCQEGPNTLQQVAYLDDNLVTWTIYAEPAGPGKEIFPLRYPLGPLVLYYLTVKFDAIMLHGSGVFDGKNGRIFTGFSGTGKSTMADLWMKSGSTIINDDRLIIRKNGNGFIMYNTPMFYVDISKSTTLNSLHLIRHAKENSVHRLAGANAVSRLMAFCIQHSYDRKFLEHHLAFLSGMCSQLPVYEVGFTPYPEIVDYIKAHAV